MKNLIKSILKKIGILVISTKNDSYQKYFVNPLDVQASFFLSKKDLVIFDVGAHFGETAFEYKKRFGNSKIYSFEPYNESFNVLKNNVKEQPNIHIFNMALGDTICTKTFNCNASSSTNSFLETHIDGPSTWGTNLLETIETTEINITTIDDFVNKSRIDKIDILKIDVQGYEYNVIEGAKNFILKNGINVIYVEIIILPTYKNQKHLDELLSLLRSYDFSLYNVFNLNYDTFGSLRQLDAIFISNNFKRKIFV